MTIASDLFRTITVKIHDISQQLPYIVVNQADDNGKIIRFVPLDHGQKVTGFTGARLYYPPRSDNEYGDYVTGVESDGAWDFTIPVGVLSVGRVGCNLAFIDGDGETYSRNVVFLVEPAVSGVFDPGDGQQTRLDKIIGTVQTAADTAIGTINETADSAVERVNKTASDAVGSIGKAEESINKSVTDARGSAEAAANSANQASSSASAAQVSERNAANSATQASQSATLAKQSETNAAENARNAASSERNAASSAEQAANIVASVSGSVTQAENAARSASQSAASAAGSASVAGGSAQAAADSASKAGESATAAKVSETNAASSASAAKISETNASASATTARQAVDGFGLEVGTTTTGEPGTNAAVEIQKTGTKYTANFTIPRGDVGPAGVNENVPLGSTSGVVAHASDAYPALPRKAQVHGRTVENHTVEPTKLTVLGENLLDLSFIKDNANAYVSGDKVVFKLYVDSSNDSYTGNSVAVGPYKDDTKYLIPVVPNSRLHFKAETSEPINSSTLFAFYGSAYDRVSSMISPNVSGNIQSLDLDVPRNAAFISVRLGVRNAEQDATITMRNICLSYTDIEYVPPEKIETNLPSDISLADGDTLTISETGDASVERNSATVTMDETSSWAFSNATGYGLLETSEKPLETVLAASDVTGHGINVVGQNLLLNTQAFKSSSVNGGLSGSLFDISGKTYNGLSVRSKDNISSMITAIEYHYGNVEYGASYTFSFWAKGDVNQFRCYFYGSSSYLKVASSMNSQGNEGIGSDGGSTFSAVGSEWTRCWVTWTLNTKEQQTDADNFVKYALIRTDGATNGGSLSICGCKLEKGTKATDWSPAPGDFNGQYGSPIASDPVQAFVYTNDSGTSSVAVGGFETEAAMRSWLGSSGASVRFPIQRRVESLPHVELPMLPAPTFNVYTTGGYIPPTVDVGYEQDVNLVLQALEAKIASFDINQTIMKQGA